MEGGSLHQLRRGTPAKTRDPLQDAILGEYTGSPDPPKYGVLSEHGIRGHLSCSQTQSSQVFHMPWRERSFPLLTASCMPERDLRQCHSSSRSRVQEVTALSYQRRPFFTFFFLRPQIASEDGGPCHYDLTSTHRSNHFTFIPTIPPAVALLL